MSCFTSKAHFSACQACVTKHLHILIQRNLLSC
uniref:Uncharacterized protein n=1 Tax=Arundo donax TaxID=35708 RepID=A0A0A9CI40_ARUDO